MPHRFAHPPRSKTSLNFVLPSAIREFGQFAQGHRQLMQKVIERDDPNEQTLFAHDRHPSDALGCHQPDGLCVPGAFLYGDERLQHQLADLDEVRIETHGHDLEDDVPVGHNADWSSPIVDVLHNYHGADMIAAHQARRVDCTCISQRANDVSIAEMTYAHGLPSVVVALLSRPAWFRQKRTSHTRCPRGPAYFRERM